MAPPPPPQQPQQPQQHRVPAPVQIAEPRTLAHVTPTAQQVAPFKATPDELEVLRQVSIDVATITNPSERAGLISFAAQLRQMQHVSVAAAIEGMLARVPHP
jgi:hypothetical protein